MDGGQWTEASRSRYNLRDTVARCTVQVYPKSWTAIYIALDNVGMWNIRSEDWARQYLGQQFYLEFTPRPNHGEMNFQFQGMLSFAGEQEDVTLDLFKMHRLNRHERVTGQQIWHLGKQMWVQTAQLEL
ncbi:UNVERIFIED_CONTAM: L-ascorbate oxidase [Sesamum radiatum]|uniref:L-ascorbate oxidase n=1 Tax=Sesamum radiatum TaxID=300843 RepID=A0AAW2KG79_SESRA